MLSQHGWIIGDCATGARLITEYDDVLPGQYQWMVWAKKEYKSSSFDNPYNYWSLKPTTQTGCEFKILSSKQGDCRPRVIANAANPFFWCRVIATTRNKDGIENEEQSIWWLEKRMN